MTFDSWSLIHIRVKMLNFNVYVYFMSGTRADILEG